MRKFLCGLILAITVSPTIAPVLGATDIFYDRFDYYCTPNPYPNLCTTSSTRSDSALRAVWQYTAWNYNTNSLDNKGANMQLEDDQTVLWTAPYGGRCANGGDEGQHLGQNTVTLLPYIQDVLGPSYNVAAGSDQYPLTLKFYFSGGIRPTPDENADGTRYSNGYMELALDDAQAPTDYVMVGGDESETCYSCFGYCQSIGVQQSGLHVPWPSICQSYEPRTAPPSCPPLMTNVRSALAVGALAMLDNNPCHCGEEDKVPQNDHLSYYDGFKWRSLRSNQFPAVPGFVDDQGHPGGTTCAGVAANDFTVGHKFNLVRFTIKTSTVEIGHSTWLYCEGAQTPTWIVSSAIVPRVYTGAFNKLRAGTGVGCELNNGSYTCASPRRTIRMGEFRCDDYGGWQTNKSKYISFDRVRLQDGIGSVNTTTGACCQNDGTCVEATEAVCVAEPINGRFQGINTTCAGTLCCPYPFADADHDGDVDQDDFGAFQLCYNGEGAVPTGCECFDRNKDNKVNGLDFTTFGACYTGANVPWSGIATPSCSP